ncbi:head GIN domain-containing protein [Rufibacter sp. XAAS-G3-1]|uniref:head GIN domain-containing protein n=1 Tax=Rufibacter sp. XAAS-G3-1 TaxID=2729134 RepID=UPI0015E6C833|nr:head GIN domain-containing protein [Rufibacter sp. XAAS-G3-1]
MHLRVSFHSLLLLCFLGIFTACDILGDSPCLEGDGQSKTEARAVPSFTGVDMRIAGNVYVTAGPKAEVKVESFANLLPEIVTELEGSTLVIRSESCLEYSDEETTVYITLPDIEYAELQSSGQMRIQAVPSSKGLKIRLTGSGTVRYLGSTNRIQVTHTSSGDVDLDGFVSHLETTLTGSGKILGYSLRADTVEAKSTGSGHQQIWVDKVLEATVNGSGNIYYRGSPSLVSTFTTGWGKVLQDD